MALLLSTFVVRGTARHVRSSALIVCLAAVTSYAAPAVQTPALPAASPAGWLFVTIGEAYTRQSERAGMEAGFRMFTAPDLPAACAALSGPATLHAGTNRITLRVGVWFVLSGLRIVARDDRGRLLPRVPIRIEVEEQEPALLNLRSDLIADGGVRTLRTGSFAFRASTICPGMPIGVVIPARVID